MIISTPPILDIQVHDFRDITSLGIVDLSTYAIIPSGSNLALQITPPGYDMINVPFTAGVVNVYKCIDLGIECPLSECCPLPDGIYDVIYSVIPDPNQTSIIASIEKTFIRVDNLKCSYQKAFLKVDLECDCHNHEQRRYKEELKKIDLLINGSVAAANDCNNYLAYKLYQKAENMLNNICCKFGLPATTCNQCSPCVTSGSCSSCSR